MPTYHEDDEYEDEYDDELLPMRKSIGTRSADSRRNKGNISHPYLPSLAFPRKAGRERYAALHVRQGVPYHSRPYGAVPRTIHRTPYPEYRYPSSYYYHGRPARSISAVIGGVLLILAIVGFAWYWNYKQAPSVLQVAPTRGLSIGLVGGTQSHIPTIGRTPARLIDAPQAPLLPTTSTIEQIPALVAAGITLQHPSQNPTLNQQQALLIASQLEPEAAASAQSTTSQFVLVSTGDDSRGVIHHAPTSNASAQPALNHVPAWMILYQGIPLQPNDASADPKPNPHTSHNLYVFLNATTGHELLAIWV